MTARPRGTSESLPGDGSGGRRTPAAVLVTGTAILVAIGTVVLICRSLTARDGANLVDALFTATSAVCVTGLVVVDTATYWSPFGQVAILVLFQLGGLGFMTASTLLLFTLLGRRTGLRDRMLVQASTGTLDLGRRPLSSSCRGLHGHRRRHRPRVLTGAFLREGMEPVASAWWGLFHAVSAFNNAGFDLTGASGASRLVDDPLVLGPLAVLRPGGPWLCDHRRRVFKRRWVRLTLETKVVLLTSLALIGGGGVAILLLEWSIPVTLGGLPVERVWNARSHVRHPDRRI